MDAYLIEARSIGGLSGSPVFYHSHGSHAGVLRPFAPNWLSSISPIATPQPWTDDDVKTHPIQSFYLMGIIQGHCNQKPMPEYVPEAALNDIEELNTGIAIVTPIGKILDLVDSDRTKH